MVYVSQRPGAKIQMLITCKMDLTGYFSFMPVGRPPRRPVGVRPPFSWLGGDVCLDFVNTVSWRPLGVLENERFRSVRDLEEWARVTGLPIGRPSDVTLSAAIELRSLLHRMLVSLAAGNTPDAPDLDRFDDWVTASVAGMQVRPTAAGARWSWVNGDGGDAHTVLHAVVLSAVDLLRAPDIALLRGCANERCGWLFLDRSRKHNRRWCDMRECGARAKARRYRSRHHAASTEERSP